jgi:hypothetical protein
VASVLQPIFTARSTKAYKRSYASRGSRFCAPESKIYSPIFWDITPVVHWKSADVSEEHVASIFRSQHELWLLPDSCWFLACFTLEHWRWRQNVPETLVYFKRNARRYIPEDRILHTHCSENLKSYKTKDIFLCRLQPNCWQRWVEPKSVY